MKDRSTQSDCQNDQAAAGSRQGQPRRPSLLRRLLHAPLAQFLALGALLFGLDAVVNSRARSNEEFKIVVTAERVDQLRQSFAAQVQRPPTAEELDAMIEEHVREEML